MNWKRVACLGAVFAAVLVSVLVSGCSAPASRPNVVIIVSDDAGYVDLGFSGEGVVPTPSIDRIAQEGVRFTDGYVTASVCSPSRAGLLTGRYQQRFGHEFNLNGRHERDGLGMPGEETTFAEMLRDEGYATAAFGKWHVGAAEGLQPVDQGFDEFHGLWEGSRSFFKLEPGVERGILRDGREPIEEPDDLYVTDWIGSASSAFVRRHVEGDSGAPFALYVSHTAPHTPMDATEADLAWASARMPEGVSRRRLVNGAMTHALDRAVGSLLDTLDEEGVAENTLVVFINDNGGATNNGSDNGSLRGMKGSKWEGGLRVPYAMRWPAAFDGGRVFGSPVSSLDIAATAAAAAGVSAEEMSGLDGVDLAPFVRGESEGVPHGALFWRRGVAAAVRMGDWKLIRSEGNPTLLFDLAEDPGERSDLAAEHPGVVASMLDALASWESGLAEPGWSEGAKWERNQRLKHRIDVRTRADERKYP